MGSSPPARPVSSEEVSLSASRSSRSAQQLVASLAELRPVHEAFAWFRSHARQLEDLQLQVTSIAAPPWGETPRSDWLKQRFIELGLSDVHQDELGNIFGTRTGSDLTAPYIALSAHLDTVFPAGTEISARRDGGKLYGAGISDNSSGITALLAIAAAMRDAAISNSAPIVLIGDVGEEGEGDLRGMRHIFQQPRWSTNIAALVVLDGAGTDTIIAEGLGSRRYEITIRGHGGHSWSDFGEKVWEATPDPFGSREMSVVISPIQPGVIRFGELAFACFTGPVAFGDAEGGGSADEERGDQKGAENSHAPFASKRRATLAPNDSRQFGHAHAARDLEDWLLAPSGLVADLSRERGA